MWAGTLARGIIEKSWDVDVSYETDLAPILSDQAIRVFSELALEAICDLDCSRVGVFTTGLREMSGVMRTNVDTPRVASLNIREYTKRPP